MDSSCPFFPTHTWYEVLFRHTGRVTEDKYSVTRVLWRGEERSYRKARSFSQMNQSTWPYAYRNLIGRFKGKEQHGRQMDSLDMHF